jgi:cytochrome c biogenesis protein CcmG/thiol:disulfide interchange protein DsbE
MTISDQRNIPTRNKPLLISLSVTVGVLLICGMLLCTLGIVLFISGSQSVVAQLPTQFIHLIRKMTSTETPRADSSSFGNTFVSVGAIAPNFTLKSTDGNQITLSDFRGKPVLVNFWAVWCGPCLDEIPLLNARYEKYSPMLVVLAIDQGDSLEDVKQLITDDLLTMPVLMDPDYAIGDLYGLQYYPTSFFIDAEGVVRAIVDYSMTDSVLDDYLSIIGITK